MTKDYTLRILPKDAYDEASVTAYLKREMQIKPMKVLIRRHTKKQSNKNWLKLQQLKKQQLQWLQLQ